MKIECVLEENRRLIRILLDDEIWREIDTGIFGRRKLFPYECASLEEFERLFSEKEMSYARNYALRRLARQSYSSVALARLLGEKRVSESTIEKIIQSFQTSGYLNDEEWIDNFVRRQLAQHNGLEIIKLKLRAKGISEKAFREVINKYESQDDQKLHIDKLLKTRYRSRNLKDIREKQKVIGSLMRKGFCLSKIKEALSC